MDKNKNILLETTQGAIKIKLFWDEAPLACENFYSLTEKGYYNGIIFHRIIEDFMIQGGDPTGTGRGGESIWGKSFKDELLPTLRFDKTGLIAMANAGANTNGSQFFITTSVPNTRHLHMKHTIFGEVIEGMDVVKKLEKVPVDGSDRPLQTQKIIKASLV